MDFSLFVCISRGGGGSGSGWYLAGLPMEHNAKVD